MVQPRNSETGGANADPIATQLDAIAAKLEVLVTLKEDVTALAQMLGYEQTEERKKGGLSIGDVEAVYKYKNTLVDAKLDTDSNIATTLTITEIVPSTKAFVMVGSNGNSATVQQPPIQTTSMAATKSVTTTVTTGRNMAEMDEDYSVLDPSHFSTNSNVATMTTNGSYPTSPWIVFIDYDLRTSRFSANDVLIRSLSKRPLVYSRRKKVQQQSISQRELVTHVGSLMYNPRDPFALETEWQLLLVGEQSQGAELIQQTCDGGKVVGYLRGGG